jgi:hypothetical protein
MAFVFEEAGPHSLVLVDEVRRADWVLAAQICAAPAGLLLGTTVYHCAPLQPSTPLSPSPALRAAGLCAWRRQ